MSEPNRSFPNPLMLITGVLLIVILYFGRDLFIPLSLAILLSFLLTPVVQKLQRWRVPRVPAVFLVTLISFVLIGLLTWAVAHEVLNLARDLPQYKENLKTKIQSIQMGANFGETKQTVKELGEELSKATPDTPAVPKATRVEVIEPPLTPPQILAQAIGPLLKPLAIAGIVIVFVIFMLLRREDLRDRFIRLIGRGHLHVTTQALDDTADRISRYLFLQLLMNLVMGVCIGVGLYLIGLPNAILWGFLSAALRFVPYLGAWIAAAVPTVVALAVFQSWQPVILILVLFIVLEVITGNVVEPWLYGSHIGLSPIALIVAAAFWTWLWGPIGLLLSTPLTVCLVVMGKYIPQLEFLDILLGDEPVLDAGERFYQRLLAGKPEDAEDILEEQVKEHSVVEAWDLVIIPALRRVQQDHHLGEVSQERKEQVLDNIREIVEQWSAVEVSASAVEPHPAVLSLPAYSEADEIAAGLFVATLKAENISAGTDHKKRLAGEMIEIVREYSPLILCICALPPSSNTRARYLCKRVRAEFPELPILVGLWNATGDLIALKERLHLAGADKVVTTLAEGATEANQMLQPLLIK